MKAASSALGICNSLIACNNCGVSTIDWPCRIASFAESAIATQLTLKSYTPPRKTAAPFLLVISASRSG